MTARRSEGAKGAEANPAKAGKTGRSKSGEDAAESSTGFETALERLEEIVDQLEQGDLALEDALSAFEEGVRLSKQCATQLDAAERRIEQLTRENGDWAARPFEGKASDAAAENDEDS